ncbi:pentatricopeptide repeat-containing protein At2g38420, mitochondrial [Ananas comosus]|uniref:Pentatricopeptide repeat-containing protein At2g38420, mitochondrial n=1 Tax=Ananas comosus TaxID=4615 RepID=A0A6P5G833_ANACO|nr:pentatricopeptide repeat-containing protein At2g38420, mitochondrial [Ananas comosus]
MRRWKPALSPHYKTKRHERVVAESCALESFKLKLGADPEPGADSFVSLLTDSFRAYDSAPTPAAYSFALSHLFRHPHLLGSHLPQILSHLESSDQSPTPEAIFLDLIRNFGKFGLIREALDVFFKIPRLRCAPTAKSLNLLLGILCRRKEGLLLVRDVLLRSPELNIRIEESTFRVLVRALCRIGKVGSAIELMRLMPLHECEPDAKMYSLVLRTICKELGSAEAVDFLEEMRSVGFVPSVPECNAVIGALVRDGKVNDAYFVLNQMIFDGRRPDVGSYNMVLSGLSSKGNFKEVDELFDEMLLTGTVPDKFTYNTYIDGLCKRGDFERAGRMVECMGRVGCNPDIETYNILIAGYVRVSEIRKAREVMNEVRENGIRWNSHTFRILIDGLCLEGRMMEAYQLFLEMLREGCDPGPSSFDRLVCGLCEKGLFSEAIQVLMEMVGRSYAPDARSWTAILEGLEMSSNLSNTCLCLVYGATSLPQKAEASKNEAFCKQELKDVEEELQKYC